MADFQWRADEEPTQYWKVVQKIKSGELLPEAIFDQSNIVDVVVLKKAWNHQASVGLISKGPSTGFLVSSNLIVTNHHVFSQRDDIFGRTMKFNYQLDEVGGFAQQKEYQFDEGGLFFSDGAMDIAIAQLVGSPSNDFGIVPFKGARPLKGGAALVIQHSGGLPKKISFGDTEIKEILPGGVFFQYLSDTLSGSSGSPIFDERFDLIGVHHAGKLTPDGNNYFRNEGISFRAMLERLPNEVKAAIGY